MLQSHLSTPSQSFLRHCCINGRRQPVFFSLSLIRARKGQPDFFVCSMLPTLSCDCSAMGPG